MELSNEQLTMIVQRMARIMIYQQLDLNTLRASLASRGSFGPPEWSANYEIQRERVTPILDQLASNSPGDFVQAFQESFADPQK